MKTRLTLIKLVGVRKGWGMMALVKCECGKEFTTRHYQVKTGRTKSCGCLQREAHGKRTKHGDSRRGSSNALHQCWTNLKSRCNNKNNPVYRNYGGRGIKVCSEWNEYLPFKGWALANGWHIGLTLDRVDNDKGYSADNCRWISHRDQMSNTSSNHYIEFGGRKLSLAQWSRETGLNYNTIRNRVNMGWDVERILQTRPLHVGRRNHNDLYDLETT